MLQKVPILGLGPVSKDLYEFGITIAQHTTNPDIRLRDQPRTIQWRSTDRYPFILMVDEILDPGNLGAIIRSAYYLGAEALIVSGRNSAPLSSACLKSASGATEYLPIYEYTNSVKFMDMSTNNGWKFYAAVPPPSGKSTSKVNPKYLDESQVGQALLQNPCCLMLGQEGEGLRPWLARQAHYTVGISRGGQTDPLVDSLNVSVAAAILCNRFLNPSPSQAIKPSSKYITRGQAKEVASETPPSTVSETSPSKDIDISETSLPQDVNQTMNIGITKSRSPQVNRLF